MQGDGGEVGSVSSYTKGQSDLIDDLAPPHLESGLGNPELVPPSKLVSFQGPQLATHQQSIRQQPKPSVLHLWGSSSCLSLSLALFLQKPVCCAHNEEG